MADKKLNLDKFLRDFIKGKTFDVMGLPVDFASLKGKEDAINDRQSTKNGVFIDPFTKTKYIIKFTVDILREKVMFAKICEIGDKNVEGKALPSLAINDKAKPTIMVRNASKRVVSSFLKAAEIMEIGDQDTNVKVDPEKHLMRSHNLVGKTIRVNRNAMGDLKGKAGAEGQVVGVFIINNQIVGVSIKLQDGEEYYAPNKDVNYPI
jgi:hypothetical protein